MLNYQLPHFSAVMDTFVVLVAALGIIGIGFRQREQEKWRRLGTLLLTVQFVLYGCLFVGGGAIILWWATTGDSATVASHAAALPL
mgnify:CR=1 FL=1|jgi:hypothetical protein|tara:strand:- start:73 stop:330 length:258 start_codon:yes stop_codon:yes gene_type:complete